MSALKRGRYLFEYGVTLAAASGLRTMGLAPAQAIGRFVGRAAFGLGVARATTLENLEKRLGLLDPAERRRVARAAYANFGQTAAELAFTPALKPEELDKLFTFEGLENLEAARAAGRGIVCVSAHYGNWEWMGAALIRQGFSVTFLIGTQSNPYVDRLFNEYRAKVGIRFVRIQNIRESLRVLKSGGLVALLGDQNGDKWGKFVPFFGVPTSTHSIGELLARRSGAALAFGVPLRLGPRSHHLKVHMIPKPDPALPEAAATAWVLAETNRLLEEAIRAHPEQWLWMHRRWRARLSSWITGQDRVRAETGAIVFDMVSQTWHDAATGEVLVPEGWRH